MTNWKDRHVIQDGNAAEGLGHCSKCGPDSPVFHRADRNTFECWAVRRERRARRRVNRRAQETDPALVRKYWLKTKYGMTPEAYDEMLLRQSGLCAICGCGEIARDGRRLAVDHCHATGAIRGLLCNRCNRGLGLFKDDVTRVRAAADYLIFHASKSIA